MQRKIKNGTTLLQTTDLIELDFQRICKYFRSSQNRMHYSFVSVFLIFISIWCKKVYRPW